MLISEFRLGGLQQLELPLRYNIAPTQAVAAIRWNEKKSDRELAWLRWGLVPRWADDAKIGNRMINARAETVSSKPAFRHAFRERRCLIPADGFYEWQKVGRGKHPYFIHRADDRPFAFAGLWERWHGPDQNLETCTILTTEANKLIRPLHDRMPVILAPKDYDEWLDPHAKPESLQELLTSAAEDFLTMYPVDREVNSPARDEPGCVRPLERDENPSPLFG